MVQSKSKILRLFDVTYDVTDRSLHHQSHHATRAAASITPYWTDEHDDVIAVQIPEGDAERAGWAAPESRAT